MYSLLVPAVLLIFLHQCETARILGVVPTPSYSHQIVFHPLWKELSLRGHKVTVVTANPINNSSLTNLTEISVQDVAYKIWNEEVVAKFAQGTVGNFELVITMYHAMRLIVQAEVENPEVQKLIKNKNEHFDLVIIEPTSPVFFAFATRFNCPLIEMYSLNPLNYDYSGIGNPAHPILNPSMTGEFEENLTFFERVISALQDVLIKFMYRFIVDLGQDLVKEHFGEDYPSVHNVFKNMSMMFVNANLIFFRIRPILPNIIQIGGGSHLDPPKSLPKDLKKYLDTAKEGFIYFSLGSNVKSKDLTPETTQVLLETFAELPYKVLWKFELDQLQKMPANVYTSKWFPQQDVLRHSNIKLFITQGGLQSIEESLHSHVPMVGMPFFGDQPANVKRLVIKGMGLPVEHTTLTKEEFKRTILKVIVNPKYKAKVAELANLVVDQPMTGLERAVWWTEYVIRHKGAKHLRSPALDIPTYQYYLLDVIGFCLLVALVVMYIIVKIVKLLWRFLRYCCCSKLKEKRH